MDNSRFPSFSGQSFTSMLNQPTLRPTEYQNTSVMPTTDYQLLEIVRSATHQTLLMSGNPAYMDLNSRWMKASAELEAERYVFSSQPECLVDYMHPIDASITRYRGLMLRGSQHFQISRPPWLRPRLSAPHAPLYRFLIMFKQSLTMIVQKSGFTHLLTGKGTRKGVLTQAECTRSSTFLKISTADQSLTHNGVHSAKPCTDFSTNFILLDWIRRPGANGKPPLGNMSANSF